MYLSMTVYFVHGFHRTFETFHSDMDRLKNGLLLVVIHVLFCNTLDFKPEKEK